MCAEARRESCLSGLGLRLYRLRSFIKNTVPQRENHDGIKSHLLKGRMCPLSPSLTYIVVSLSLTYTHTHTHTHRERLFFQDIQFLGKLTSEQFY